MKNDLVKQENKLTANYHRTKMQKEMVLQRLIEKRYRITKQRKILLDIILQEECASCKEIYYKAASMDSSIGLATVYRMVNLLEEIGAISRKNMYRISCGVNCDRENVCVIKLDDQTMCRLSSGEWYKVISEGLRSCGYIGVQKIAYIQENAEDIYAKVQKITPIRVGEEPEYVDDSKTEVENDNIKTEE